MRSKVLVVSSVLLGLGSALVSHTAVGKTEDKHSICTALYLNALGDGKLNCKKAAFVDLNAIQDKIKAGAYNNSEQATNNVLTALGQVKHISVIERREVTLFDDLKTFAKDGNHKLLKLKDRSADAIEARLMKSNVVNDLLNASTNDLMNDYRLLRKYDQALRIQQINGKKVGESTTEIDQRREKVTAIIAELKVIAADQMAQYDMKLTKQQSDRLLESAIGQEEIKLVIIGHNLDRGITVIQARMKASQDSELAVEYEGDLALLNKVASAAIQSYINKINDSFLRTLNKTIEDSKAIVANNQLNDKNKRINEHVQMLAMSYIEILKTRVEQLAAKKESLRPNFSTLAVNYATANLAQDAMSTVIASETTNTDIDSFLKLANLSNNGADGMDVTQSALLKIEDSLFAPK